MSVNHWSRPSPPAGRCSSRRCVRTPSVIALRAQPGRGPMATRRSCCSASRRSWPRPSPTVEAVDRSAEMIAASSWPGDGPESKRAIGRRLARSLRRAPLSRRWSATAASNALTSLDGCGVPAGGSWSGAASSRAVSFACRLFERPERCRSASADLRAHRRPEPGALNFHAFKWQARDASLAEARRRRVPVAEHSRQRFQARWPDRGALWPGRTGWSREAEIDTIDVYAGLARSPTASPSRAEFTAGCCRRAARRSSSSPAAAIRHGRPAARC